jgi:putative membrane protein
MITELPYCGAAPSPGELLTRFNLDPVLIVVLALAIGLQLGWTEGATPRQRAAGVLGWLVASVALLSPLCALSVALFSARVGQHMILLFIAAPLIAMGLPTIGRRTNGPLGVATLTFFAALWFWHMPLPYEATFTSVVVYWCMHISLFGSAIWLWCELLHPTPARTAEALLAGALTSMQMGLLGAVLSLAGHSLFRWHLTTTWPFGLTPLADQQLAGVIMWVPGMALFMWVALCSLAKLWTSLEEVHAA